MRIDIDIETLTFPDVELPEVYRVEQICNTPALSDDAIAEATERAVAQLAADPRLKPGASVAIGCGSRGIANLHKVVRAAVAALRARGLCPFLVPAMGSHGGATPEGQTQVLLDYLLSAEVVGAEIRATMQVDLVGNLGPEAGEYAGQPVYFDRIAHAADAVLLINRVKSHTDFSGPIESGIAKMAAIGLGKRTGAESIHHFGAKGLTEKIPHVARHLVKAVPLVGGIAILENELGHTAEIHALPAGDIAEEAERLLLQRARNMAPRLPFADIDVLVVDEMGKNVSGTGLDTHVVGRALMPSIRPEAWGGPHIRIITALDLTPESHGNGCGMGLADIVPSRLIAKVDFTKTYINCRTSGEGGILKARVPLIQPTPEDCVRTAIATCGKGDHSSVRLARIRNTADTRYIEVSAALLDDARRTPGLVVCDRPMPFDLARPVSGMSKQPCAQSS